MEPGSRIGHYRIVSRLGAGGMGEVYLARDERLDRLTAIKILAAGMKADTDTVRRFTQEAKAAAALSHPNIAHIYDAGEENGIPFLAMEYVEGRTLNLMTEALPLSNDDLLMSAMQIADALDEAHRKGIVHRDIKPSNLIRSNRGQTKILDFGLAKLSAAAKTKFAKSSTSGAVPTASNSDTGAPVGSLPYMSPEQSLGREIDLRTDIFSFGAVLYELATGRRAFVGSTPAAIFDAILNRTPTGPRMLNPNLPESLDRIIRKCLEKDPSMRYQTASGLMADLKIAQRDLAQLAGPSSRTPNRTWIIVAVAMVTVVMSAVLGWWVAQRKPESTEQSRTVPLTSFPGSEREPSFSPDGNQVAFSWNQGKEDDLDIFVKVVEAGMPLRLTTTPASEFSPAWSPDGKFIAFLRQTTDSAGFYLIPALGGLERKLSDASPHRVGADSPFLTWSPDGKQLALVDRETPQSPLSIYLLDMQTNQRRRVTSPPADTLGDSSPTFSADGTSLAFVRIGSLAIQDIHIVNLREGKERQVTNDKRRIYGLAWSPLDGKILFSSARNSVSRLWRLNPSGGAVEAVTGIGDQAGYIALSRSGTRLAYTRTVLDTNVWRYPIPDRPQITPADGVSLMPSTRHEQGPRYSPDGTRIIFASNRSGSLEIWVADANGVNLNQLTTFNGPPTGSPMWSPDGKYVVFDSRPNGNPDIYIISADGGMPRRLTSDASQEVVPSWSRDGKWIYFASNRTGRYELFKQPAQGGIASQITHNGAFHGIESPDGQFVYYAKSTNLPGLWRVPTGGGKEEQVIPGLRGGYWGYWGFGKDGIYWIDREDLEGGGGRYPLHYYQFSTKKDVMMTHLMRRPFNSGLSISPDFRNFLYTQVDQSETDIMMVDGFR